MRVLDLFSGIGGMSLGLQMADPQFETVQFVEIDDYCRQVLELRWPGVPVHDDVRTFTARPGGYDLVTAGYPCQPFSQAGNRHGAEDDRHLWPQVSRILAECRPSWFLGENVAGHITMGLDDVLSDLEGQGYTARAFVIGACAVDAPHRRSRVWIVAHASRLGRSTGRTETRWQERHGLVGPDKGPPVADASGEGLQGREQRRASVKGEGASRSASQCGEDGWSPRWLPEPAVGRVAHGVPRRVDRLKGLGHSVVPQVVEKIARAIIGAAQ